MVGIRLPPQVGLAGLLLHFGRERSVELPELESGSRSHVGASLPSSVTFMPVARSAVASGARE
jgi:hypothetical protein